MLTADQFVEHNDGLLEQQRQDSCAFRKNRTFALIFKENWVRGSFTAAKNKSKKLSIRNGTVDV